MRLFWVRTYDSHRRRCTKDLDTFCFVIIIVVVVILVVVEIMVIIFVVVVSVSVIVVVEDHIAETTMMSTTNELILFHNLVCSLLVTTMSAPCVNDGSSNSLSMRVGCLVLSVSIQCGLREA